MSKQGNSKFVVAKFGGTSVRDSLAIKNCVEIVKNLPEVKVVVVSATSQTTNHLEAVADCIRMNQKEDALAAYKKIVERHSSICEELSGDSLLLGFIDELDFEGSRIIEDAIQSESGVSAMLMDQLYSLGERFSSSLFSFALQSALGKNDCAKYFDAREFLKTDSSFGKALPKIDELNEKVNLILSPFFEENRDEIRLVAVTQGFIGSDNQGRTTTLGREGSDFSAALLASSLNAESLTIWSDVEGVLTTDPRVFSDAQTIPELSYKDATQIAKLGAKVLFPETLAPVQEKNIPVYVGSSLKPNGMGTWIKERSSSQSFFSIVLKKGFMFRETASSDNEKSSLFFIEEKSLFSELSKISEEVLRKLERVYQFSFVSSFSEREEGMTLNSLAKLFGEGHSPLIPDDDYDECDGMVRFLVLEKECQGVLETLHNI